MALQLKRIYDRPDDSDGLRILVDRLWPRGISKKTARIDEWLKEIAPSHALRKWFQHKPERWGEFQKRYRAELRSKEHRPLLRRLRRLVESRTVTLLFAAKDEEHNNARVIASLVQSTKAINQRKERNRRSPKRFLS